MWASHDHALIALSVAIAIQGGYVSLHLATRLAGATGPRRKAMLAAAAAVLGGGIWAMHFIGMLALRLPVAVTYDALLTLISFLVSILVTGLGLHSASYGGLTAWRLAGAGLLMGIGISAMHYLGMAAIRADAIVTYAPGLVATSVGVGIAASTFALWLAFTSRGGWHRLAGATALGCAIAGMHYTAMAAASFLPVPTAGPALDHAAPVLSQPMLAMIVAVASFVLSGLFLLMVLPDRPAAAAGRGGAAAEPPAPPAPAAVETAVPTALPDRLAVEKNRATIFLPVERIVAIRAEAHYTRVFDGRDSYFCSLSVSELEGRLDPGTFVRVHRSHIINIRHARAFRRRREQGLVQLDAEPALTVPVSRSRVAKLRAVLGAPARIAESRT